MNFRHLTPKQRRWIALVVILALAAILAGMFLPMQDWIKALIGAGKRAGNWGVVVFIIGNAIAGALLIPGWIFTVTAGLMYGVARGTLIAHAGSMAAAALAFLCGRYLFRRRVLKWMQHNRKFQKIDAAVGRDGWKIVCLLRLSPVIPFFLQNYLYSVTSIRFWPYMFCSIICTFPGTVLNVYLGAVGHYSAAGEEPVGSLMQWLLLGVGLIATVVASVYIKRMANKALLKEDGELAGPQEE